LLQADALFFSACFLFAGALLRELCGSLLFFAGVLLQGARQFLSSGAVFFGGTRALGGAFLPGGSLLFTFRDALFLLPGAFLCGPLAFQLCGAFSVVFGLFLGGAFLLLSHALLGSAFLLFAGSLFGRGAFALGLGGAFLLLLCAFLPGSLFCGPLFLLARALLCRGAFALLERGPLLPGGVFMLSSASPLLLDRRSSAVGLVWPYLAIRLR
jgi:hypothetical protein